LLGRLFGQSKVSRILFGKPARPGRLCVSHLRPQSDNPERRDATAGKREVPPPVPFGLGAGRRDAKPAETFSKLCKKMDIMGTGKQRWEVWL